MTTTIKVDAHAGWPVEVEQIHLDGNGNDLEGAVTKVTVPANTEMTFYVHQTMRLNVREGKREPGT